MIHGGRSHILEMSRVFPDAPVALILQFRLLPGFAIVSMELEMLVFQALAVHRRRVRYSRRSSAEENFGRPREFSREIGLVIGSRGEARGPQAVMADILRLTHGKAADRSHQAMRKRERARYESRSNFPGGAVTGVLAFCVYTWGMSLCDACRWIATLQNHHRWRITRSVN